MHDGHNKKPKEGSQSLNDMGRPPEIRREKMRTYGDEGGGPGFWLYQMNLKENAAVVRRVRP